MKIGDRVFVRGYIDEIRKDTVIIRNAGGYFGTIPSEVITGELPPAQPKVIRCKDCKFYSPMNRETKTGICNLTIHQNFGDDWFCAGAERRTGCDRLMPTI